MGVASGVKEGSVLDHIDLLLGHKWAAPLLCYVTFHASRPPPPSSVPQSELFPSEPSWCLYGDPVGGGGRRV